MDVIVVIINVKQVIAFVIKMIWDVNLIANAHNVKTLLELSLK